MTMTMDVKHCIIELEKTALDRWCRGDPSGFLEISAADVVYFDPFLPTRLNGWRELSHYYESIRGKIFALHHEMIAPLVQEIGDAAILTFQFISSGDDHAAELRWNCTEVYRRQTEGWRIAQTHWSFTSQGTQEE
ncbi:MAG: nuclear transport factor 2 family protein [Polyangiaceae bacterium]|nr:nuclear transport factor 2 family protein [Polyangiaceae bacterium]